MKDTPTSQHVAILCPGPSLPAYWGSWGRTHRPGTSDGQPYGCVIGVNTAAWKYNVDWMAAVDADVIKPVLAHKKGLKPRAGYITNPGFMLPAAMGRRAYPLATGHPDGQCGYSFPNALAVGIEMAGPAGAIDVFGFDCAQVPTDFTGKPGQHTADRWREELTWLRRIWTPRITVFSELAPEVLAWLLVPEAVGNFTPPPIP